MRSERPRTYCQQISEQLGMNVRVLYAPSHCLLPRDSDILLDQDSLIAYAERADDDGVRVAIHELLAETEPCSLEPDDGGLPCPEGLVCAVGGMGARCTVDPSHPCDQANDEFVRCLDGEVRICTFGFESTMRVCDADRVCTVGEFGPTCAINPDAPCPHIDRRNRGCNGNAVRHCVEGFFEELECADGLYCQVEADGSAGYCGARVPSCTAARCAGEVPVSCVDGIEIAALPCEAPAACSISGLEASCALP